MLNISEKYKFAKWFFKSFDINYNDKDIYDILEIAGDDCDNIKELANNLMLGMINNIEKYEKNIEVANQIIEIIIESYKKNDFNILIRKSNLLEFLVDVRN